MIEVDQPRRRRPAEHTLLVLELRETLTAVDLHLPDWQSDARLIYAKARRAASNRDVPELMRDVERLRRSVLLARKALLERTDELSPRARNDSRVADRFRSLDCILTTLEQAEMALQN